MLRRHVYDYKTKSSADRQRVEEEETGNRERTTELEDYRTTELRRAKEQEERVVSREREKVKAVGMCVIVCEHNDGREKNMDREHR